MTPFLIVLAVFYALSYAPRAWRAYLDRTDKAWHATGIRQVFKGYDQASAVRAAERAARQAVAARLVAAARAPAPIANKKVRKRAKRQSNVQDFRKIS